MQRTLARPFGHDLIADIGVESEPFGLRCYHACNGLPDGADRDQQDHHPDGDEDIVEAVDQAEIFL